MASLGQALPGAGTAAPVSTTQFNTSSVFVPKKKQAAMAATTEFPALGDAGATAGGAGNKGGQQQQQKQDEDPCRGKPKEFFIYDYD